GGLGWSCRMLITLASWLAGGAWVGPRVPVHPLPFLVAGVSPQASGRKKRGVSLLAAPSKAAAKPRKGEAQRERMVKALAELLQRSRPPPARPSPPPDASPTQATRTPPEQDPGPSEATSPSPSSPPRGQSHDPMVPHRPRGRPRGSFKKKPGAPRRGAKAPGAAPAPPRKSQQRAPGASPSSREKGPGRGQKKLPLLLKFVSKAKLLKSGRVALARARLKPPVGRKRGSKRTKSGSPRRRDVSLGGSPTPPAPPPEQPPHVAPAEPASPTQARWKRRRRAQRPAQREGAGEERTVSLPCPAQAEEESAAPASIAQSTRAQCLKRGRGRPPLTPSQRAERVAAAQREGAGAAGEEPPGHKATFLKNIRQFIMPVHLPAPPDTELIKMEDVDAPGVVRKVAIRRVASLASHESEEEEGSGCEAEEQGAAAPTREEAAPALQPAPLSGMDKVYSLLTRAKVQLFKIDQQQLLRLAP
ncbi:histone-lysine N-methyltransferase 2B, partial [Chelydra serpentina]